MGHNVPTVSRSPPEAEFLRVADFLPDITMEVIEKLSDMGAIRLFLILYIYVLYNYLDMCALFHDLKKKKL